MYVCNLYALIAKSAIHRMVRPYLRYVRKDHWKNYPCTGTDNTRTLHTLATQKCSILHALHCVGNGRIT